MSPTLAFAILTWAAIILLFLAVGAVLREVRLLRATMLGNASGFTDATPSIRFDRLRTAAPLARIVLAADTDCPLCTAAADLLVERATANAATRVSRVHSGSANRSSDPITRRPTAISAAPVKRPRPNAIAGLPRQTGEFSTKAELLLQVEPLAA